MFKFRDLLILAAVFVGGSVVYFRSDLCRVFDPVVGPVMYYVDAPQRERDMLEELDEADRLADVQEQHIAVLSEEQELATGQIASLQQRLTVEQSAAFVLRRAHGELAEQVVALRDELAGLKAYKARFETLCQRIKQLDGDVHAISQLVSE
jgi:hypothetical protein